MILIEKIVYILSSYVMAGGLNLCNAISWNNCHPWFMQRLNDLLAIYISEIRLLAGKNGSQWKVRLASKFFITYFSYKQFTHHPSNSWTYNKLWTNMDI